MSPTTNDQILKSYEDTHVHIVSYLAELNQRTYLWVELGLQTAHDKTGRLINRAHDFQCYVEGVQQLRKHGIRV